MSIIQYIAHLNYIPQTTTTITTTRTLFFKPDLDFFCFIFSLHCEQCLKRNAAEKAGRFLARQATLPSSNINHHKHYIHTLLILRQRNIRTFARIPHGMFPGVTRIHINRSLKGERMFTTQIVRAVMRAARVRYILFGTAAAGGIAAKMVS